MDADRPTEQALIDRATFVRNQIPTGGLFAGLDWRVAPEPFPLDQDVREELETLGRVLLQFYRAANLLYRLSVTGRQPAWIARWLDLGKSPMILGIQRSASLKNELPRVIRPDLLLTESGLKLTELDSVPGGIGLSAWLNLVYTQLGMETTGGADGMLNGFAGIFGDAPCVHVVVSEESAAYRPEMEWLARELNTRGHCFEVRDATPFTPGDGDAVYRFFELFDVDHVPAAVGLFEAAARRRIRLTPPPKSHLEEKLLLALLWNRNLRMYWRQEMGAAFFDRMIELVPRAWVLDPSPLPPHAGIPGLELTNWQQLKELSQREREFVLKISGYSPEAWGARGVYVGSDLPAVQWSMAVDSALGRFATSPYVLQQYAPPRIVKFQWVDFDRNAVVSMPGRVRLCPYYFVHGDLEDQRARLGGVLATVCPADKKMIHGMREAILAPCGT